MREYKLCPTLDRSACDGVYYEVCSRTTIFTPEHEASVAAGQGGPVYFDGSSGKYVVMRTDVYDAMLGVGDESLAATLAAVRRRIWPTSKPAARKTPKNSSTSWRVSMNRKVQLSQAMQRGTSSRRISTFDKMRRNARSCRRERLLEIDPISPGFPRASFRPF